MGEDAPAREPSPEPHIPRSRLGIAAWLPATAFLEFRARAARFRSPTLILDPLACDTCIYRGEIHPEGYDARHCIPDVSPRLEMLGGMGTHQVIHRWRRRTPG